MFPANIPFWTDKGTLNATIEMTFCINSKLPDKLQPYGLYVYYVVHICDFGMLRVNSNPVELIHSAFLFLLLPSPPPPPPHFPPTFGLMFAYIEWARIMALIKCKVVKIFLNSASFLPFPLWNCES